MFELLEQVAIFELERTIRSQVVVAGKLLRVLFQVLAVQLLVLELLDFLQDLLVLLITLILQCLLVAEAFRQMGECRARQGAVF